MSDKMFRNDEIAKRISLELEKEFGYVNDNYAGFTNVMETKIAVALSDRDALHAKALAEQRTRMREKVEGAFYGTEKIDQLGAMMDLVLKAFDEPV